MKHRSAGILVGVPALLLALAALTGGPGVSSADRQVAEPDPDAGIESFVLSALAATDTPFYDKDDVMRVHQGCGILKRLAGRRANASQDSQRLISLLDELEAWTSTEGSWQIVDFARSEDIALVRLREDLGLQPPDGGALVRHYTSWDSVPPAIKSRLSVAAGESLLGWTILGRYVATCGVERDRQARVLHHELAHAFVGSYLRSHGLDDDLPKWFGEGIAEYLCSRDYGGPSQALEFDLHNLSATREQTRNAVVFRYLRNHLGFYGVNIFLREVIEGGSVEIPMLRAVGVSSFTSLEARALAWHRREEVAHVGIVVLCLIIVFLLVSAFVEQRALRSLEEREQVASELTQGIMAKVLQRTGAVEMPGESDLDESCENLAMAYVELAKLERETVTRRVSAYHRFEAARHLAPHSPRVRRALSEAGHTVRRHSLSGRSLGIHRSIRWCSRVPSIAEFVKHAVFAVVLAVMVGSAHSLALGLLHPVAGRDLHFIFGGLDGGRTQAAIRVFAESALVTLTAVFILSITCRASLSWPWVGAAAGFPMWSHWMTIALYPGQSPAFQRTSIMLLASIPALVFFTACLGFEVGRRVFGRDDGSEDLSAEALSPTQDQDADRIRLL